MTKCEKCGYEAPEDRQAKVMELDLLVKQMDRLGPKCRFDLSYDPNAEHYRSLLKRAGELEVELGL